MADFPCEAGIKVDTQLKSDGQEMGDPWPGQAFSLQVEKELFHERSKFQDVLVFKRSDVCLLKCLIAVLVEHMEMSWYSMASFKYKFYHTTCNGIKNVPIGVISTFHKLPKMFAIKF